MFRSGPVYIFTSFLAIVGIFYVILTGDVPIYSASLRTFGNTERLIQPGSNEDKTFDVLLNAYMRSGSSITGHLLGKRDDVFYFYEPFWLDMRFWYFKGRDSVCRYLTPNCVDKRSAVYTGMKYLRAIYNCTFDKNATARIIGINSLLMYKKSGASWSRFLECKKESNSSYCIPCLAQACQTAKHRVTKVLRLSLDNTEILLRENPRLKVIHLVRDPRGIINSHIRTAWFPFSGKTPSLITKNAQALCPRMLNDIKAGIRLMNKYPGRVKIIQYEDLNDTVKMAKYLYEFVGMNNNETYRKFAANAPAEKPEQAKVNGNNLFRYRETMTWDIVKLIDSECEDVYSMLGYKLFASENELRNLSVSAIKDQLTFTIWN